jgi:sporulation protein YlmC with PRC-barrel domain
MTDTFITVGEAAAGVVENVRPARPGVGIVPREPSQIIPEGEANGASSLLAVITSSARDGAVDVVKLEKLMDLYERITTKDAKTYGDAGDLAIIAKAKRQKIAHIGAKQSKRAFPFGKTSPWKKRIDGTVVRRGGE